MNKFTKFTLKEKVNYYKKRVNDENLSFSKRSYAALRLGSLFKKMNPGKQQKLNERRKKNVIKEKEPKWFKTADLIPLEIENDPEKIKKLKKFLILKNEKKNLYN